MSGPSHWWPLAALAVALAGCAPPGAPAGARARMPRPGDAYVVLTRESTPSGMVEHRETWTLLDTSTSQGRFAIARDGAIRTTQWRRLGPVMPRSARRMGQRTERVTIPAGTYECARTMRTFEEQGGRVMRVDEWWAPGVPTPVQRWTRWQGLPDAMLHAPPRRPENLVMGAEWTVLEHAPRR